MSGIVYTFAGAYAISYMTDLIVPDRYRHAAKAAGLTMWARHTTQGKIANYLGRQMLSPVVSATRAAATHPATWMGLALIAQVNLQYHVVQQVMYDGQRPHHYQELDSLTDHVRQVMMPIWIDEDHPLLIGESYWD